MTKKFKDPHETETEHHDRFVRREPTLRTYRAEPPKPPAPYIDSQNETRGDSTGIRLILEQVGELNSRTYEIHGHVSSLRTMQKEIKKDLCNVRQEQELHGDKLDLLTHRVDRHSGKILSHAGRRNTLAPLTYFVQHFSTILKIVIIVILGILFLLGVTVSITDLGNLFKL